MTNQEMKKRLDQIIEGIREKYHIPSVVVSVHKDGESFFCGGGLANVEENVPADENTIYAIASASKAFIATAVCILCDEGKCDLDKPVKTYLPDFEMYGSYMTEHLTVRDALGHRSGLPRHDIMWLNDRDITIYDVVHRLRYLPPAFEPRARMHYQNLMFTLATVLTEKLSGQRWQDFVTERILKPLGMTRTYLNASDYRGKVPNQAEPYQYRGGQLERMAYNDISHLGSCGCISSTVHDLDRWARLQLGRGQFEGKRVFSEKMADQLHNPQMIIKPGEMTAYDFPEVDFTCYGQGWFIESYRGHKLVHHGGTIDGFKSLVGFLPNDGVCFSVLTNLNRNQSPAALGYIISDLALGLSEIDWAGRFWDFMESTLHQAQEEEKKIEDAIKNAPAQSRPNGDYAGEFFHPGYGRLTVREQDGGLVMHILCKDMQMLPAGYDLFCVDGRNEGAGYVPVRFNYDLTGAVVSLSAPLEPMCAPIVFDKQK